MCSEWAQHFLWIRFRRADDTDACAHRLITGLLPEQHWMVAAERRVRSEGCPTRRISHGSRTRMLSYMHPHTRMTTSKQTVSENFQLYIWRGGDIEILTRSKNRHHAGANCGLTVLKWLARRWRGSLCHANPALSDAILLCVIPVSGIPTYWACCLIRSSWGK